MKLTLSALFAVLLFAGAAPAEAKQPHPLPNPDRPAVTPVFPAPDAGVSSAGQATISAGRACRSMRRLVRRGNGAAGLRVFNLKSGKSVCSLNAVKARSLASNTKLFTTATALERFGPTHRFRTEVFSSGPIRDGVLRGNLFLRGGGDPSFGTRGFVSRYLGGAGTEVHKLANQIKAAGIRRVTGRVVADDTIFDRRRGVADSGYATSPWIGPLSGLSFNAGYTSSSLSRFSSNPARLAAVSLGRSLRARGVRVRKAVAIKRTPQAALTNRVARQVSPDMVWMARITNLNSVNYWAEMLLKNLGAEFRKKGTTWAGTGVVMRTMAAKGIRVRSVDGSGLTRSNRASPQNVVKLLVKARRESWGSAFTGSLPTAGVDGTLASRMRGSAAQRRCHAKTGTLTGVTALSGYCFNRSGRRFAFSILMNSVSDIYSARAAQDRIAALIARL